jgi:thiamine biosynthesis protein ThiI
MARRIALSLSLCRFYELHRRFIDLDQTRIYLLYCEKGVMSRLHASHLLEQGFTNVKVYRPS